MGEDTRYCGNCKREVSAKNFTVHSVHCQRNIAVCTLCSEAVPRSHYQQHVEANHKSIQCSMCEAQLEPLQVFAHEKEECPRRLLKCQHCELEVIAVEFQRHMEYCESRTELCKGCTKYVQFKHLQFHYEHDHRYLTPEEKDQENSSDEEGSECPICLGPVTLPLVLECGHTFCMVCVKGIANTTKNCAICRRDIARDMLMDIRFCREEDIIKNYVNKPREKKTQRSHSVPSRTSSSYSSSSRRVARTTQDYDDMVSALLSSRTSSTSYRYQRPANTHTPPSYTPYSGSESCKDSCKDTDSKDDDCCCSSSKSTSSSSSTSATTTSTSTTASTARTSTTSTTSSVAKPPPASSVSTTCSSSSESSRSTSVSSSASRTSSSVSTRSVATSSSSSSSSSSSTTTSSSESSSSTTASSSSYSSYSNGARPRRPTSLALETTSVMSSVSASVSSSSASSRSSGSRDVEPPANATQEQYDRWLAFQLAKAEDDLPPSEFNKKHRPTFRRSLSMPERADSSSDSSDSEDSDSPRSRRSSRRPPASPRTVTNSSSSSSSSSSSRSTPISKSSSDSNASSGSTSNSGSALSTGARPKNAGLKKRVSFKEDAPAIRREAPVMLPCEFCDEMFAERDLMRHQTSCEQNETQLPRASRIAQRAAAAAAAAAMSSSTSTTSSGITTTSSSSTTVETSSVQSRIQSTASSSPRRSPAPTPPTSGRTPTPVCTPPRKTTTPSKSPAPVPPRSQSSSSSRRSPTPVSPGPSRSYTSGWRSSRDTSRGSPVSTPTSPPPSCPPSISPPPVSPPPTTTITIVDQKPSVVVSPSQTSGSNRPFSVSPAPSGSTSNSSVSSGSMSSSSVSTTPSTSSSASPVPAISATPELAPPDTPTTDLEYDYEDEDGPFMRPRRGRLLSSAIFSWRSISGSRRGYTRSNTAPLEDTGADEDTTQVQPVITSRSATQLPAHRPSPDVETAAPTQSSTSPQPIASPQPSVPDTQTKQLSTSPQPSQEHAETVFIKNPNKYRAPPPPQTPPNLPNLPQKVSPAPTANLNGYIKSPTPWEKAFMSNKATSPPPPSSPLPEKTLANGYVNGVIKFDSKTMMNGHMSKEIEELIPCEFCKQVFSPDKFRSHQTMCEAAVQPPALRSAAPLEQPATSKGKASAPARHNKGPAPSPPESYGKDDEDTAAKERYEASHIRRMERSQSVKDDRSSFSEGIRMSRRLERASSIKESRTRYGDNASLSRRWGSREVLHSNSMESSASLASGGWSGSTSNLFSSYAGGHSWTQHINSVRSDVRSLTAAANCASSSGPYYDNGGDSDNGGEVESEMCGVDRSRVRYNNTLLMEVRAALNKNSFSHVANESGTRYRERSSSRPRPSSMYTSSGTWGSMFDLSSPTRSFNISDAFSSASLASKPLKKSPKKYPAPQPPSRPT
ncbi:flocculation protein FLO11-like isoform X2 [Penaeus japonicus]|uniref:flocculation protein FLO11-like isoform X2 n=1 Tax=Penaeus japonicus TaxID=27405 RepID=UPI001C715EBA|nr:flocculation protein FLO11-like isoform X2 [Penaeus japonicus]